jgi:uncharacterized membrane protein YdjX (TVP38/TMEM64 family)
MAHHRTARWILLVALVLAVILVPFVMFGSSLDASAEAWVRSARERPLTVAAAVALLLTADVFAPVPSSIVSTLSGVFLGAIGGAAASALGLSLGCVVGYFVGGRIGRPAARSLLGSDEIERLESGWSRFGDGFVVVARPVPVLAEASTLFAGMSRMPLGRFFTLTALANVGISIVYATVGAWAANVQAFWLALTAAIVLPGLAMLVVGRVRDSSGHGA